MDRLEEIITAYEKEGITALSKHSINWLISEIESLRQQFAAKEEAYQALLKQNMQQEQELEEKDATICGVEQLLKKLADKLEYTESYPAWERNKLIDQARQFSFPTCPHKERAEGITQAETAEQARLINERDAAKEEVEKLKEEVKHAQSVSPWRSKTIQVEQELVDLQAELASLKIKIDCGNESGVCHYYADEVCNKHEMEAKIRMAMEAGRGIGEESLRQELASLREVVKAAQKVMRCSIPDRDEKINDAYYKFSQEYRQVLSSHESKWKKVEKEG